MGMSGDKFPGMSRIPYWVSAEKNIQLKVILSKHFNLLAFARFYNGILNIKFDFCDFFIFIFFDFLYNWQFNKICLCE